MFVQNVNLPELIRHSGLRLFNIHLDRLIELWFNLCTLTYFNIPVNNIPVISGPSPRGKEKEKKNMMNLKVLIPNSNLSQAKQI